MDTEQQIPVMNPTDEQDQSATRRATARIEAATERMSDLVWRRVRKRPFLGVAVAGGTAIALASAIGVGELALGMFAAYAAWEVLAKRKPPSEALRDAAKLEHEVVP